MQPSLTPHPFWNFSLEVYGGEGVARACLDLQDRRQADVNVLLFCCWLGASGRGRIDKADLKALVERVKDWQLEVIRPLRLARRKLAEGVAHAPEQQAEPLRRRLADAEIEAEHVEQLMLAERYAYPGNRDRPPKERLTASLGNLVAYSEILDLAVDRRDRDQVAIILTACFPNLLPQEIGHALNLDRA
ncbi:MAG: TIGR02444 family protein [Rhodospirillales bacterium]